MSSLRRLADLDGRGRARESGQTSLEGTDLAPGSPAAGVDAGHPELVGRARLELQLLEQALVALDIDFGVA